MSLLEKLERLEARDAASPRPVPDELIDLDWGRPTFPSARDARAAEVLHDLMLDEENLLASKNAGYGRNLQRHGLRGIVIRLSDKMMRLENLTLGNVPDQVGEPIEETLKDVAGYALKALQLLRLDDLTLEGEWRQMNLGQPLTSTPSAGR